MPAAIHRSIASLALLLSTVTLAACSSDAPTSLSAEHASLERRGYEDKVALCHHARSGGYILEVGASALAAHEAHGDYPSTLIVSHDANQPTDGVHFARIGDALNAARAARFAHGELVSAACRITIRVLAGAYSGTASAPAAPGDEQFPLVVDVPDITLHGALLMGIDRTGRATGVGRDGNETTLAPSAPLPVTAGVSTPLIVANAHPGGSAGNGLVVEGFVFQSGHAGGVDAGGQGILAVRAERLLILGNRFEGGFTESVDLRAATASVLLNHLSGTAGTCDICLAGPGRYAAWSNRLLAGGIPGIAVSGVVDLPYPAGVEAIVLPAAAETWADVINNEVRDHRRTPVGTGIRVEAIGIGAPNVHNTIHAVIRHNLLVNNQFGMIVHAGFPLANTDRRGDVDVTYGGNVIEQSCQAKLLVSLSRHSRAWGMATNPYLLNSTYSITLGGDVSWGEVWFSHPAGFGNTLIVDGAEIPNGGLQFFSTTSCPGM